MVAVGGPLGTTTGRWPPAAATRTAGGPAEGAEGAGQPGTLAAGLAHAGAGPPAGGCSVCPPGISLTGAAAAGALMEKEKAKGAAGSRRAPRRPAASLSAQALPQPAARRPTHMVTPPPPTARRPHVGPASPAGGRERGRAEGGPGPLARPTAAAPSTALPRDSQGPRPAAARRVYSAMRRTRRRSGRVMGRSWRQRVAGGGWGCCHLPGPSGSWEPYLPISAPRQRGKGEITPAAIQKMLDENNHLIQCIMDYQNKGKTSECSQYQQMLHTNLVYLATIADSNQNMQSLLPAPPTQNMPMGPGGMSQSGPPPPPRSHNMSSDGLVGGGPPAPHMQNQMNGQMPGPMMHQQPPSQQYNMPQAGGQHYQGQQPPMGMMGQVNQGNHMMGQRQIPPYRPPQQGPPQQYSGQEDYYGDQYSHGGQGPPEGMNQQYYPDGHNDYGYQQPSYPEQGYDRPYEDSSQHYYEGGNSQYGQQQDAYQGPPQQQGYPPQQQQYPGQQGYPGQQQGYGPSQGGPGPQYPNYPQGQGQQYGGYRPTQPGPPQPPQQRPYGYDQGQYGNYQQ
uniref:SS18 subunit of BAF chromatin remodeling complex n=1 Tax=Coturnix japonica TaxID=93934 RepID=A0A8C2TE90_COTJA